MSIENAIMPWRLLHLSTFCETKGLCTHELHLIGLERIFDMFEKKCKPNLGWRKAEKSISKTFEFWCCLCLESALDQATAVVVIRASIYNCKRRGPKKGYVVHKKCLQALSCNKDKMELVMEQLTKLITNNQVFISKHCGYLQSKVCHSKCRGINNSRLVNCGMFNCYRSYHLDCLPSLPDISVDYLERIVGCPYHKYADEVFTIGEIRRMSHNLDYSISPNSISSCIECGGDITRFPKRLEVIYLGCCQPSSFIHYQCVKTRIDRKDYDCPSCHSVLKYQRSVLIQGLLLDSNCDIWKICEGDDYDEEEEKEEEEEEEGENNVEGENENEDIENIDMNKKYKEDFNPSSCRSRRSSRLFHVSNNQCMTETIDIVQWLQEEAKEIGVEDLTDERLTAHIHSKDDLASIRQQFEYPKNGTLPHVDTSLCDPNDESIYLCGNSLGLMPKATRTIMNEQLDKWSKEGVFGHLSHPVPWAHGDEEAIDGVSKLVGGHPGEVGLMNGLTVNVHILLTAFYTPTPTRHKILLESRAFPSDHYAIESQIRLKGGVPEESMICLAPRDGEDTLRTEDIIKCIEEQGDSIAIVFFSGIQYFTGQLFEIEKITKAAHSKGCLVGWDLAHAYANVPLKLHDWDVDFACWCSYKYGCTGAGGLAGLFVHERFKNDKRDRMLGWWSHRMSTRFQMDNVLDLDDGAAGYRISNPPVHLVVPVLGFLEVMKTVTLDELRKRSVYLTGYLEYLVEHFFEEDSISKVSSKVSVKSITPKDQSQRGCQLSLKFNISIDRIYPELIKRGVACDKRYPYIIRIAPVHLYNNFIDVRRFIKVLIEVVKVVEQEL